MSVLAPVSNTGEEFCDPVQTAQNVFSAYQLGCGRSHPRNGDGNEPAPSQKRIHFRSFTVTVETFLILIYQGIAIFRDFSEIANCSKMGKRFHLKNTDRLTGS